MFIDLFVRKNYLGTVRHNQGEFHTSGTRALPFRQNASRTKEN